MLVNGIESYKTFLLKFKCFFHSKIVSSEWSIWDVNYTYKVDVFPYKEILDLTDARQLTDGSCVAIGNGKCPNLKE